jgi:hypothetical protein
MKMKKTLAVALAVSLALAPVAASAQSAKPAPAPQAESGVGLAAAVGLGALAGVVGFNLLALGVGALPGGMAYGAGTMIVPAEMSVAMSRVYAAATAVGGALVADHIYMSGDPAGRAAAAEHSWVNPRLLSAGAGAITGIASFNLLTAGVGAVPAAGAPLAAVPMDVALGSRMLAALSGGVGALAGVYVYESATGEKYETDYKLSLAAGAVGGVALGNWLSGWTGGLPLSGAATARASALGTFASSAGQAASRVYVVTAGVLGAWVADALYGVEK